MALHHLGLRLGESGVNGIFYRPPRNAAWCWTPEKEALTDRIQEMTAPIFVVRRLTIMPRLDTTVALAPDLQNETLHPDESVAAELQLNMLASIAIIWLCSH